nr:hypothetical protein CFP56_34886 [Quercus suber]
MCVGSTKYAGDNTCYIPCFTGSRSNDEHEISDRKSGESVPGHPYLHEKPSLSQPGQRRLSKNEVAERLITVMCDATHSGKTLQSDLDAIVHESGWWDRSIAERVLNILKKILGAGTAIGPAMRSAFDKVCQEASRIAGIAEELAHEHPILTGVVCAVIALGILWQSLYGGRVPVASLFAYLQRLGMTWNGSIVIVSATAASKL